MSLSHLILGLVALQRLAELAVARRNTRRLLAEGGCEAGHRHYPLFILLHGGWLLALFLTVPPYGPVDPAMLAALAAVEAARLWVMVSLGRYWTTRVITLPHAPLVRAGPYRWLRHPNYLVVAAEIAVLPLVFGAWEVAVVFSALNGALVAHRIAVEDRALSERRAISARGSSAASG